MQLRLMFSRVAFALLSLALVTTAVSDHAEAAEPGAALTLKSWRDARGNTIDASQWHQGPIVVAFLGTECPLAKQYAVRLEKLHQELSKDHVQVLGVMSNSQDSPSDIVAFMKTIGVSFPLVVDPGAAIADQFGAQRTPEVFLLDKDHRLVYRGRVDNQFTVGVARPEPTEHDLRDAITQLLAGQPIKVARTQASGCIIGRPKQPQSDAQVTYSSHIAAIINKNCVNCHRPGEVAPFSLTSYEDARDWAEMIGEVVANKRMPPWHANPAYGKFKNDCSLSDHDQQLIAKWVAAGAPLGDAAKVPPTPTFTAGWQLPREPDLIIPISDKPFAVAAEGEIKYQYFRVDPKLTEDRWVEMAELVPGNRAVVHHILAFVRPKNGDRNGLDAERGFFTGYVPGLRVEPWPKGYAKRLPANSEIIFQVHYTPIGTPQQDISRMGLVFCDPSTVTHEVLTASAVQPRLRIPPHDANYKTSADSPQAGADMELLALAPHMHLRGKAFRYELVKTNGAREILLDIPNYDFNWQHTYGLPEPMPIPEGSKIECTAVFDNSENNPSNPAPEKWVSWGDQTWEEMMIGYFHYAQPVNAAEAALSKSDLAKLKELVRSRGTERILKQLDSDSNGELTRAEVPEKYHVLFRRLDADNDSVLTRDELKKLPQ